MRILIITDTSDYGPEATLYPLARELCLAPGVARVAIADRAVSGNQAFFAGGDPQGRAIQVRNADKEFTYETQAVYPVRSIARDEVDAVWMRMDLPSDTFLHYVETLWPGRFISNRPSGIVRTASKSFLLSLQPLLGDLMPRVQLCQNGDAVRTFRAHCPDIVLKVLHSFGGKGVVRVRAHGDSDLRSDAEIDAFLARNGSCLAMEYLDNIEQSDNRLIVSNGAVLGVLARKAALGGWLCNLMAGGSYGTAQATMRETEMVARIDPAVRRLGIHFYGIDTLMNARGERVLSEINTTNPGCAWRFELATGEPVCRRIARDFIDNVDTAALRPARSSSPAE